MIRETNEKQLTLAEFDRPFLSELNEDNRWVKLADAIPWQALSEPYLENFANSTLGRPAKPARLVIGAVTIKHKLVLSDRETVDQISENPYLQYFVGLSGFQTQKPFDPSLFVWIRRRMGQQVFDKFQQTIVDELESYKGAETAEQSEKPESDEPGNPPDSGSRESESENPIESSAESNPSSDEPIGSSKQGRLILDATVVDQAIRYPTDLSLLN